MLNNYTLVFLVILLIAGVCFVTASINYKINDETKLSVRDNETIISNVIRGTSALKLSESLIFLNETDSTHFSLYHSHSGEDYNNVSEDFESSLILQTEVIENPYDMEMGVWDKTNQKFLQVWNTGLNNRAHTFVGSVKITHGNKSFSLQNENLTLCDEANYVDCDSRLTGADLFVNDDIEAQSIYANENIVVVGNLDVSGVMTGTLSLGCDKVNISGGNITYSAFYMSVLGEGGIADNLVNINGGSEGDVINIFPTDSGSDITLVDGTGNLNLGANCVLKSIGTKAELRKNNGGWNLIICLT